MIGSLKYLSLGDDYFAQVETKKLENSKLVHVNQSLKKDLNIDMSDENLLSICSGEKNWVM